ncbi:MAG TPA: signal peptidase I [Dehalococcoidia bacterium]|nr:signal peptidase I [Dehalococcoidia bacterium]
MTFPRDDLPAADQPQGLADPDSQLPDAFAPAGSPDATSTVSEADLFAREAETSSADFAAGGQASEEPLGLAHEELVPLLPGDGTIVASGQSSRRARRVLWELTQTLVLAVLIFLLVRAVAQNFRVEGPSMEPGLNNGQYLLVNKAVYFKLNLGTLSKYIPFIDAKDGEETFLFHGPQRGDVIVFRYPKDPKRDFIKRVIGVPGDKIRIDDTGAVFVNGDAIDEEYIADASPRSLEEQIVPPESYFVLGDNRPNSSDSRNWGFVPEENIIGKAMLSYWPLSKLGGVGNHNVDLGLITVPLP